MPKLSRHKRFQMCSASRWLRAAIDELRARGVLTVRVLIWRDQRTGWNSTAFIERELAPSGARRGLCLALPSPPVKLRQWYHTAVLAGRVYLIGGCEWRTVSNSQTQKSDQVHCIRSNTDTVRCQFKIRQVDVYDPSTRTWHQTCPAPANWTAHTCTSMNGNLYVVGLVFDETWSSACGPVYVYDPTTNSWDSFDAPPTPRSEHSCVGLNGKLYLIGGGGMDVLDTASGTWSTTTGVSREVARKADCAAVGSKLYVVNWYEENEFGPEHAQGGFCEVFDPLTGQWEDAGCPLNTPQQIKRMRDAVQRQSCSSSRNESLELLEIEYVEHPSVLNRASSQ